MFQVLLAGVALLSYLGATSAQCTQAQQFVFLGGLPNGVQCGLDLLALNSTPTDALLNRTCTTACAGPVAQWLLNTCNDTIQSGGLTYWCQPADGGRISRCRFVEDSVFSNSNITACGATFTGTCPTNCNYGLRDMAQEIGCCYQALYNSTEGLDGLVQAGEITAEGRQFFGLLSNPVLWNVCGVSIPDACTSPPFASSTTSTTVASTTVEVEATTAGGVKLTFSVAVIMLSFFTAFLY